MKKAVSLIALLMCLSGPFSEADDTETYFRFTIDSRQELEILTKMISIDNVIGDTVYAYAGRLELPAFQKLGYDCTILPHPGTLIRPRVSFSISEMQTWDAYPSYGTYVAMMYQFQADFPGLCSIHNIGSSVMGRDILFARITDSADVEENEPEIMYSSTMHGDETAGFVLMLRLIDSLLNGYGTDSLITRLVDSCEIWINPLANPDGTYRNDDDAIVNPTRKNANYADLNRNFPDPEDGDHPDGGEWQPETICMMNLADEHNFVLSANLHGGAEVVNYPWDTWAQLHADDNWFIDISRLYADSAQYYSPGGYLTDLNNGITNGYAWYSISGGRQDYMNWWHGCREVTLEISEVKFLPADQLPAFWVYNRVSLLDYLENSLYGVRGIADDAITGGPVAATVTVIGHDFDHSEVSTDPDVGDYHRMIKSGTYDLLFTSPGYIDHTEYSVSVSEEDATIVNVTMQPLPEDPNLIIDSLISDEIIPGDTVAVKIRLQNTGAGNGYYINGVIWTDDPCITITQSASSFPDIQAEGGTGISDGAYEFYVAPECPDNHSIAFRLFLEAYGDYVDTIDFVMQVGEEFVFYFDDFSLNRGWNGLGGSGEWTIGPCTGGAGSDASGGPDPAADHTVGDINYVLGNDLSADTGGDYNSNLATTYWAESPVFDCSNSVGVRLTFFQWLGIEDSLYDHAALQVFDGSTWITVFENETSLDESSWSERSYDLSDYADGNPDFQFRFGIGPTNDYVQYCGWNIDDIELSAYGSYLFRYPTMSYVPAEISDSLEWPDSSVQNVRVYNTGDDSLQIRFFSSCSWLFFDKDQHNIAAGDSLDMPITIYSKGLVAGLYSGFLNFVSNDTAFSSDSIPVNLTVTGEFTCGDADGDGNVNMLDILHLIAYLYKGGVAPEPLVAADVNGDGSINMLDILYLIAYLYKGGPEPDCP
jgi:hypothetical protein